MYRLINFIQKQANFFLFLVLEIFCAFLLFQKNNFHRSGFINSANAVAGSVYDKVNLVRTYFALTDINEILASENAILKARMPEAFMAYSNKFITINDTVYRQQYQFISAKVLNNTIGRRSNYLTLNRGSNIGIKPEMAVIGPDGIVGITKDVSPNFTSVLSVLHKDVRISARLKKDNSFGSLSWDGGDYRIAKLSDIPAHLKVRIGDTIVTTASSAIFPENILIGTIAYYEVKPGEDFYTIKVNLSTKFNSINHVYIVNNLFKEEQRKLEETQVESKY